MFRTIRYAVVAAIVSLAFTAPVAAQLAPALDGPAIVETAPAATPAVVEAPNADTVVTDTVVTVPYGTWIADLADAIWTLLLGVVMWALRRLPKQIYDILMTARVEQLLTKAKDYAVNTTKGATAGKSVDIDVGSMLLAKAARYALENGAPAVLKFIGGHDGAIEKLKARIPTDEQTAL